MAEFTTILVKPEPSVVHVAFTLKLESFSVSVQEPSLFEVMLQLDPAP